MRWARCVKFNTSNLRCVRGNGPWNSGAFSQRNALVTNKTLALVLTQAVCVECVRCAKIYVGLTRAWHATPCVQAHFDTCEGESCSICVKWVRCVDYVACDALNLAQAPCVAFVAFGRQWPLKLKGRFFSQTQRKCSKQDVCVKFNASSLRAMRALRKDVTHREQSACVDCGVFIALRWKQPLKIKYINDAVYIVLNCQKCRL